MHSQGVSWETFQLTAASENPGAVPYRAFAVGRKKKEGGKSST